MSWKSILKNQRTLMDFGMTSPQGTINRSKDEEVMRQQMPQIRSKLEADKGRTKMTMGGRTMDASEYWLGELDKVKSLEDFEAYKKNYKQMTNLDII